MVFLGDVVSVYFVLDNDFIKLFGMVRDIFFYFFFEVFCDFCKRVCKNFKIDFLCFSLDELKCIY